MDQTSEKEKEEKLKLKESESSDSSLSEAELNETDEANPATKISDSYEVIELIGKGGMGTVYKVRDIELDKILAVKILKKELADDTAALKRFEQETEAASKLSHPNLVSVYKHGKTETGEPYLVMDYLEGETLSSTIERDGHLSQERALNIFIQVCKALEHAHENDVLHRDIKPTNIILTTDENGVEVAKLVDFGIAKVMNASPRETHNLTQTGEVFGSPHYMSPEQCLGFMLEKPADIYSLGCSLYETITGSPPFGGSNPIQLVVKHINDEVESFDKQFKKTKQGKQLETVALKCLKKEPEERFQSVAALRKDLESIKAGKNIPKYDIKPKAKPKFTRKQLLVGFALLIGFISYSVIGSALFDFSRGSGYFITIIISVLFAVCFGTLFTVGLDKLKQILKSPCIAKDWWLMLLSVSGGLAGLSLVPIFLSGIINFPFIIYGLLLHAVSMIMFFSSGIGFLIFRKKENVSTFYVLARQVTIAILLVVIPVLTLPNLVSKITMGFAKTAQVHNPSLAKKFLEATVNLADNPKDAVEMLIGSQPMQERSKLANEYISEIITNTKSKRKRIILYQLQASENSEAANYGKAIDAITKAIDLSKEINKINKFDYQKRAEYFFKLRKFDRALNDIDSSRINNQVNSSMEILAVKSLMAQGKYSQALKSIDKIISNAPFEANNFFIRGLIQDKLGSTDLARKDFEIANTALPFDSYKVKDHAVKKAYALYRLGQKKEAEKVIKNAGFKKEVLLEVLELEGTNFKLKW